MATKTVVVVDPGYEDYQTEASILRPWDAAIIPAPCGADPARIAEAVREADAILVRESPITADVITAMTRCRAIIRYGVGIDNIDLEAARDQRIYVGNVPDYGSDEVSEHALALLMTVTRHVAKRDRDVRNGVWDVGQKEKIYRIRGRTLGLIGFGRIGRQLQQKMSGLGVAQTMVADPYFRPEVDDNSIVSVDLDTVLREADFISLHAPLTPETKHLINGDTLAKMKSTAILINTARGGLVDESALVEALRNRRILGAGVDVFEQEPPPTDHPFFALDNVVVTDHMSWYSEDSVVDLQTKAAQSIARVFANEPPLSWVNPW